MTDEQLDLLAQGMCAAYWRDNTPHGDVPMWSLLSNVTKGQWRRAARAAALTLEGNRHWLPAPDQPVSSPGGEG